MFWCFGVWTSIFIINTNVLGIGGHPKMPAILKAWNLLLQQDLVLKPGNYQAQRLHSNPCRKIEETLQI